MRKYSSFNSSREIRLRYKTKVVENVTRIKSQAERKEHMNYVGTNLNQSTSLTCTSISTLPKFKSNFALPPPLPLPLPLPLRLYLYFYLWLNHLLNFII